MAVQLGRGRHACRAMMSRDRSIGRSTTTQGTLRLKYIKSATNRRCGEIGKLRPTGLDMVEPSQGAYPQGRLPTTTCQRASAFAARPRIPTYVIGEVVSGTAGVEMK